MHVTAILLAAGQGKRLRSRIPKPLVKLLGSAVIEYSLKVLNRHPWVKDIILVVNPANKKAVLGLIKKSGYNKVRALVLGGTRRQDSVFNALKKVQPESGLVLIHDSCRPFIKASDISELVAQAGRFGAAIPGVPVKATVKQVARYKAQATSFVVKKTLDRKNLWEIQTPQVFQRELIIKAYQRFNRQNVTDDAALIEKMGKRVVMAPGSYGNIKITTPEDLIIAEAILKSGGG
jgi:2-C-methyl-D-erythritol 4-phosphate cytidylyltransferase